MRDLYFDLFYFLYYGSFAGFWNLINVYYEIGGCNGTQIGIITSVSLIVGMLVTPLWGYIGDWTGKYLKLLGLSYILTIIVLLLYVLRSGFSWYIMCALILEIVRAGANPLMDHVAMQYTLEYGRDFGKIRSFGSIGYIFGNFLTTFCITFFKSYHVVIYIYMLMAFGNLVMLPACPKLKEHVGGGQAKEKLQIKPLIKNQRFWLLLFVASITCSMMSSASTMVGTHLVSTLGCNDNMVSVYSLVSALPEMLMLKYVNQIVKKIGYRKMYLVSIAMLFLRAFGYACAHEIGLFLLFSILQCFTTGLHAVCNLQVINRIADKSVKATALTVYYAAYAMTRAVFGYIWGAVYQYFGSFMIFKLEAVIAVLAFVTVLFAPFFRKIDGFMGEKRADI